MAIADVCMSNFVKNDNLAPNKSFEKHAISLHPIDSVTFYTCFL